MGDHLRVNLAELETCGTALAHLKDEFDRAAEIVGDARSCVGHRLIEGALHDFATNWKYHRQRLVENLESVGEMAEASHQAYLDTDRQLATSLTADHQDGPRGAR